MRATLAALVALVLLSGCTPTVLREHSVSLAGSSSDLRYREVMENLAMIYANPCTLPAYSSVYSGGMDVQDGVQIDGTTTWAHAIPTPSGFSSQTLDIPLSRSIKGTLTLDPTIVPEKLRALRAACQLVLFGDIVFERDRTILMRYRPGLEPGPYFDVETELAQLPGDWLGRGHSHHDVPRNACFWAGCPGAYVWVCPENMESFSRFVLVFQRIARFDVSNLYQPRHDTRTVKWSAGDTNNPLIQMVTAYVDENGNLAITQNVPAVPYKSRIDNVGQNSDLKAVINSVIKSP
jgi:hypothetical protein